MSNTPHTHSRLHTGAHPAPYIVSWKPSLASLPLCGMTNSYFCTKPWKLGTKESEDVLPSVVGLSLVWQRQVTRGWYLLAFLQYKSAIHHCPYGEDSRTVSWAGRAVYWGDYCGWPSPGPATSVRSYFTSCLLPKRKASKTLEGETWKTLSCLWPSTPLYKLIRCPLLSWCFLEGFYSVWVRCWWWTACMFFTELGLNAVVVDTGGT